MGKAAIQRKQQQKRQRKERIRKWRIEQPIDTVEQAVNFLVPRLDKEVIEWLKSLSEEDAKTEAYRSMGMFIRNHFGLWQGNVNLLRSCGDENIFPDEPHLSSLKHFCVV